MDSRIDELRAAIRVDPGSRLFFQLGDLLRKAGQLKEAEQILQNGLDHHPRYVAAWVSLGRIQLEQGDLREAERSFARALELDPENAVAARMLGGTAETAKEWLRAVKAYKLAAALAPADEELEERIAFVERRLAGEPEEEPPVAESPPKDEITEVFEVDEVEQRPSEHRRVVSVSEEDPFAPKPTGDTGVWLVEGDVFAPEADLETDAGDDAAPAEVEPVDEVFADAEGPVGDEESLDAVEESADDLVDAVVEPVLEDDMEIGEPERPEIEAETPEAVHDQQSAEDLVAAAVEPVIHSVPDVTVIAPEDEVTPDDDEAAGPGDEDIPLATMTLARLALDQGDRVLAEKTARAILAGQPDNREAADFLDALTGGPAGETTAQDAPLAATKAEALTTWMTNVRAAAERRSR